MFERFKTRSTELERLDKGDYTEAEYARWQKEMWYIHRLFGELRALKRTLLRDIVRSGERSFSALDVGAGSGELLRELSKWMSAFDALLVGLEIDNIAAASIKSDEVLSVQGNALQLPFDDKGFDYVFCSLFLHHLEDENAVALLQEMARTSRRRVYMIDLNRQPIPYYAYKLFGRAVLQQFTLEDGALSILRSRTPEELRVLAKAAGLRDICIEHSQVNRLVLSGRR
ncbi:MAG: methyltransferase domain-containing protein [Acidobacteriota bacterium]|nr:MAG: methyltransferase domain-containing protein [Acidobacteriota bacterium]